MFKSDDWEWLSKRKTEIISNEDVKSGFCNAGDIINDELSGITLILDHSKDLDRFNFDNKVIDTLIHKIKHRYGTPNAFGLLKVVADGLDVNHIVSVNPVLREVVNYPYRGEDPVISNGEIVTNRYYPEKMTMTFGGYLIMEW